MNSSLSPSEREDYERLKRLEAISSGTGIDPVLNEDEAARYCRQARITLAKARLRGDGPPFLKLGRSVRYLKSDLDKYLASKRRRSTSDTGAAA